MKKNHIIASFLLIVAVLPLTSGCTKYVDGYMQEWMRKDKRWYGEGRYLQPLDQMTLTADFIDEKWDGFIIPGDEICKRDGGNGGTPPLRIGNIPAGTNSIILEFNDASSLPLSYGGALGKVGFWHDGSTVAYLPSVPGETNNIPRFAFPEAGHRFMFSRGTLYMPPCSGGDGHEYYAVVKAVHIGANEEHKIDKIVLGSTSIYLGKY